MKVLTELEALKAMAIYLGLHAEHQGDTAASLAVDLTLGDDGAPHDPAVWLDWLKCVRAVIGEDASDAAVLKAEVASRGPVSLEAASRLASRPVDGADDALIAGLRRSDPGDTKVLRVYLQALAAVGGSLPDDERRRLSSATDPSIRTLIGEQFLEERHSPER